MPRVCTVCVHKDCEAIDKALVAGGSAREISALFRVSPDAVQRHKTEHMAEMLRKARGVATDTQALDVVTQLKAINGASLHILQEARQGKDPQTALKAIDRIQRQIELQAKLLGQLDDRPVVNVLLASEWLQVRAVLLQALAPYPEARVAVAGRLALLEVS
jgi:hypothetical protein